MHRQGLNEQILDQGAGTLLNQKNNSRGSFDDGLQ